MLLPDVPAPLKGFEYMKPPIGPSTLVPQVLLYVDGVKVGETSGGEKTPHLMINRLCEGETSDSDGSVSARLGFPAPAAASALRPS